MNKSFLRVAIVMLIFPNVDFYFLRVFKRYWFLFVESTGTGDKVANYFGQLAAANHVKKLVERYLTLAPVFIGGPGRYF